MKTRDTILAVYVAVACMSCVRDKPAEADSGAAAAPTPTIAKTAAPDAAVIVDAAPPVKTGPIAYDDKEDLPANAGDARCKEPIAANAKPASVTLELSASPPGIDIVVPSLGVKQHVSSGSPSECHASLDKAGPALRFHCTEEHSTIDGKVYTRKSDVLLGRAMPTGTGSTKFILPCGTPAKLEPIVCPKECKKDGDQCACSAPKH
jgi:hypothetical protein